MTDNRLGGAASAYLRLHADNPVDWRQWGEAAFAEARERDVPLFVSVGYATCHWCHVMARESFEDPRIGRQLRDGFVAVKVDREELPDVDAALMAAASAFTRDLGWPLHVVLTPDLQPVFAATYLPPAPIGQRASCSQVLKAVQTAWRERRDALEGLGARVHGALTELASERGSTQLPDAEASIAALAAIADSEDPDWGGIGGGQKFPHPGAILALAPHHRQLSRRLLLAASGSDRDAAFDRLRARDGGYFRYATRRDWREPHYERMLIDNALILQAAAELDEEQLAAGLVDFLERVLWLPGGGFATGEDAESLSSDGERVEGGWHLGVTEARPALDALVVTSHNAFAIRALAVRALRAHDERARRLALAAGEWLRQHHLGARLVHASLNGVPSNAPATELDRGALAAAFVWLTRVSDDATWLGTARALLDAEPEPLATTLPVPRAAEGDAPSGAVALAEAWLELAEATLDTSAFERALALAPAPELRQPLASAPSLALAIRLAEPALFRCEGGVCEVREAPR